MIKFFFLYYNEHNLYIVKLTELTNLKKIILKSYDCLENFVETLMALFLKFVIID